MRPTRIVVFSKAPIPGTVKTRLIPALGMDGAAELAGRMLQHAERQAVAAKTGQVEICVTPDEAVSMLPFSELPLEIVVSAQGPGDLGERLAHAAERVIGSGEDVIFTGTDCPALNASVIREVAGLIKANEAVIIPALDGGYVLLALSRFDASIFAGIEWSTSTVFIETVKRIERLGWRLNILPAMRDIDTPSDLESVPSDW